MVDQHSNDYQFQLQPGDCLGRFMVTSPYTHGAIKEVYKAKPLQRLSNSEDSEEGLLVVMKVFKRTEDMNSPRSKQNLEALAGISQDAQHLYSDARVHMFLDEVNALRTQQRQQCHPNIAKILDAGVHSVKGETLLYFTEEYIPGLTLKAIMDTTNPNQDGLKQMPLRQTVDIFRQVASGISYLHGNDMIHGDVQGGNIIVRPDGLAKLTDFGNAHIITSQEYVKRGTVLYRSPEELIGKRPGKPSDVWALGVLLYQALTGKYPFETDQPDWSALDAEQREKEEWELKVNIAFSKIIHVPTLRKEMPRKLKKLVYRALERVPDNRITIDDIHSKLENVARYSFNMGN